MCLVNTQNDKLFVAGNTVPLQYIVLPCLAFEKISASIDLICRIVAAADYNGIGSVNYKFAGNTWSTGKISDYLANMASLASDNTDAVMTNFDSVRSSTDTSEHESIPKIFEINPRAGGTMFRQHAVQLIRFVKAALLAID